MSQQNGQSVQSDILDAVVAALGAHAHRARFTPYGRHELPAMNVLPEDEDFEYEDAEDIETRFRFNVRYQVAAIDAADKLADKLFVTGTKVLLTDATLQQMCRIVRIRKAKWEQEPGEVQILALVVMYEAEFSTTRTDPSKPGY